MTTPLVPATYEVNLGTPPDATDGDTERMAFGKVNAFTADAIVAINSNIGNIATNTSAIANKADSDDLTDLSTALTSRLNSQMSFRNKVINGNFYEIQRYVAGQTLVNPLNVYMCDRWQDFNSGSSLTCSQQTFALGQTDVPGATYFHRSVVTSVANAANSVRLFHYIEDVSSLAGQKTTLSFYAKADSAKPMAAEVRQIFGTGGSAVNIANAQQVNLTAGWQRFTITFDVPSIAGKTIGVGNALLICFWFDSGSNFNANSANLGQRSGTFDIANIQLEQGAIATDFELLPKAVNLMLCQRYFEAGKNQQDFYSGAGIYGTCSVQFKVTKRILPAITPTYNYAFNSSTGLADNITLQNFRTGAMAVAAGATAYVTTWTANAEF